MLQLYPAVVTLLALLVYLGVTVSAGRNRAKYKIVAPATIGHPMFERALRVQGNTLEHLVLFVPALWLAAMYGSWLWASAIGCLWLPARILYAVAYMRDPARRAPGFILASLVEVVLLIIAAIGIVRGLLIGAF
jgi:uncharacterized membrane protein YecN with MAPEG domain